MNAHTANPQRSRAQLVRELTALRRRLVQSSSVRQKASLDVLARRIAV